MANKKLGWVLRILAMVAVGFPVYIFLSSFFYDNFWAYSGLLFIFILGLNYLTKPKKEEK